MIFSDVISLIGDYCLYSASLGFIISLCGKQIHPLILAGAYLLTIVISILLRGAKRFWRILPPLIFLATVFFSESTAGTIWLLPLFLLLELRAYTGSWNATYQRTKSIFKIASILYLVMSFFTFLTKAADAYSHRSVPFFVAWLLITVINLRMLRIPESEEMGVRVKVLNVLLVVAVAALAYFFSSEAFIGAVAAALKFLFEHVLSPLFMVLIYVVIAIPALIVYIIKWISALFNGTEPEPISQIVGNGEMKTDLDLIVGKEPAEWIGKAAGAFGIILFLLICFLVLRKLLSKREEVKAASDNITRETINIQKTVNPRKRISFTSSPGDTVRSVYRKYLEFCAKHGIAVDGSQASDRICNASAPFSGREFPERLRMIWLRARYSLRSISSDEAREAKQLYKQIRSFSGSGSDAD